MVGASCSLELLRHPELAEGSPGEADTPQDKVASEFVPCNGFAVVRYARRSFALLRMTETNPAGHTISPWM